MTICLFTSSPLLGFDAKNSEPPIIPRSSPRANAVSAIDPPGQRPDWSCAGLLFNLWRLATSPLATLSQSILWHFLPMIVAYLGRLLSARIRCCESFCVEHCVEHGEPLCFNTAIASPPNVVHLVVSSKACSFVSTSFRCNVNVRVHRVIRTRAFCVRSTILVGTATQHPGIGADKVGN